MKVKTMIRRILYFPIFIIFLPIIWLFSEGTMKEKWEEEFIELTDEETDSPVGGF